jgi:hypothetical protein
MTPEDEIVKLRNWRHDVATPELVALRALVMRQQERLDKLEPLVASMIEADKIAAAVTERIQSSRRGLLSNGEKIAGLAVGASALASVVLQLIH